MTLGAIMDARPVGQRFGKSNVTIDLQLKFHGILEDPLQLGTNPFVTEERVPGDIQPGVEKSAVVVSTTPKGDTW